MVLPDGNQQAKLSLPCPPSNAFKPVESKCKTVLNISCNGYGEVLKQAKGKCGNILNWMSPHVLIHYLEIY